jgi:hypothetical protein
MVINSHGKLGITIAFNNGTVVIARNRKALKDLIPEIKIPKGTPLIALVDGYEGYYIILPDTPAFETLSLLVMLQAKSPDIAKDIIEAIKNLELVRSW